MSVIHVNVRWHVCQQEEDILESLIIEEIAQASQPGKPWFVSITAIWNLSDLE